MTTCVWFRIEANRFPGISDTLFPWLQNFLQLFLHQDPKPLQSVLRWTPDRTEVSDRHRRKPVVRWLPKLPSDPLCRRGQKYGRVSEKIPETGCVDPKQEPDKNPHRKFGGQKVVPQ